MTGFQPMSHEENGPELLAAERRRHRNGEGTLAFVRETYESRTDGVRIMNTIPIAP